MKKKSKMILPIFLTLVFLSLTVLLGFAEEKEGDAASPLAESVTDIPSGQVLALVLSNSSGTVSLLNSPSGIEGDLPGEVSQKKSAVLLYTASHLQAIPIEIPDPDPASFGFVSPLARVSLLTDADTVRFSLGRQIPFGSDFYLQREGEKQIYRLSGETASFFLRDIRDLHETTLLDFPAENPLNSVESLTLENSAGRLSLEPISSSSVSRFYRLTEPTDALLNWENTDKKLLQPLMNLNNGHYAQEDDLPAAETPYAHLTVTIGSAQTRLVFYPADAGGIYAQREGDGRTVLLDRADTEFLNLSYRDLIGESLYDKSPADISRISASFGEGNMELSVFGEGDSLYSETATRQYDKEDTIDIVKKLTCIPPAEEYDGEDMEQSAILTLFFTLRSGEEDLLEFYPLSDRRCAVFLNGKANFTTYRFTAEDIRDTAKKIGEMT